MRIPDKLPNPPKYRDFPEMTKEEWEDYYSCREKYDIEMTDEEIESIFEESDALFERGLNEEACTILNRIPAEPFTAISAKIAGGFRAIKFLNLSKAKKVYPDEF